MKKSHGVIIILLLVSLAANLFLSYYNLQLQQNRVVVTTDGTEVSADTLVFLKLFINEVLRAEGEIDFDKRLELETAVRELNDRQILSAWQVFVESQTEGDAQAAVRHLLGAVVSAL